jgi:hypothetical protein
MTWFNVNGTRQNSPRSSWPSNPETRADWKNAKFCLEKKPKRSFPKVEKPRFLFEGAREALKTPTPQSQRIALPLALISPQNKTRGYRAHRKTPPILLGSRAQSANTERDASNHDVTMFGMSRCRQTLSKSISDHQISAKRHEF